MSHQVAETVEVSVDKIKPSPYQPRLEFKLEELIGSIRENGILAPLLVRKINGFYELIDGERRYRVAKELGIQKISANVLDVDNETAMSMVWSVNIERKDYTTKEKVKFANLLFENNLSIGSIAKKMRYDKSMIITYLNVNKLPDEYQELIWGNVSGISIAHIHELKSIFNGEVAQNIPDIITKHLDLSLDKKLTVNEFKEYLRPQVKQLENARVEAALKTAPKIIPDVKITDDPQDLLKAAQAIKKEAKKREQEQKTPEQIKSELEAKRKTREERKRKREQKKAEQEKKIREKIRKEITNEVKEEMKEELKSDPEFKQEVTQEKQVKQEQTKEIIANQDIQTLGQQIGEKVRESLLKLDQEIKNTDKHKQSLLICRGSLNIIISEQEKNNVFNPNDPEAKLVWSNGDTLKETLQRIEELLND